MRSKKLILAAIVTALALAACSADDTSEEAAPAPQPEAPSVPSDDPEPDDDRSGGVLVVSHPADPTGLHPNRFGSTNDRNIITNIYDTLVEFDLNDYSIVGSLAESWEASADGLTWTFNLRQGVKFHNGEDFTAEHVVASVAAAQEPESGRTTSLLTRVESTVAVDDHTVAINLSQPDRSLLSTLVDVYIRPLDESIDLSEHPTGTGPFMFVRWDRNQEVEVERNPDYWREGLPYLDGIIFRTIPDGSVASLQLRNGDVDIMGSTPLGEVGPLQAAGMQFFSTAEGIGNGFYHFHINTRVEPWSGNPTLRQALAASVNRQAAAGAVFGFLAPMNNPVEQNQAWLNPDAGGFTEFDPDVAPALMEEAGYPDGVDGGEMIVCGLGFEYNTLAQVVQQQAAAVGIDITITVLDVGTYVERSLGERAGDFSLALCGLVPKPDEYDLINHTYAKLFIEAQGYIDENPEFFELLTNARSMASDDDYRDAIFSLQETVMESQHNVVIGGRILPHAAASHVRDFIAHTQGHMFLDSVWIER